MPNEFGDLGDDGISEGPKSVHPRGNPMSHSTHVGFNEPLSSAGDTMEANFLRAPAPPHLHIAAPPVLLIAVGVGIMVRLTARPSSFPLGPLLLPSFENP